MKTALFTNFTNEEFVGYWDGKPRKYEAGKSEYMPDYLAKHYAKHIVNRELLKTDKSGNAIYKNGEKFTSPKRPEDVPVFMELFNKAYTPDKNEEVGNQKDNIETLIDVSNKNRKEKGESMPNGKQDPTKPQVIVPLDFDEDDSEESFEGNPSTTLNPNLNPQSTTGGNIN